MIEMLIANLLALIESPLSGIGIEPVAILRGLEIFFIVTLTLIIGFFVRRFIDKMRKRSGLNSQNWNNIFLDSIRGPARLAIWVIGLTFAAERASIGLDIENFFPSFRSALVIAVLTWSLLRFVERIQSKFGQGGERDRIDKTTAEAISRLARIAIIITSTLIILQTMGFSVSAVLAFGGLGGIAVGFAAKDLLANFFGGLVIFLDRPFGKGDWIRSPDRDIEGTVTELGWRVTTILTFDMRPLYIPNASFLTISVENPSRMLFRRIFETFGIRYSDINSLYLILSDIKILLENHEDIASDQTLMVNFNSFGESAVEFFVYCMTKTTVWTEYHNVKQEILFEVSAIVLKYNAEFAFPTKTVHLSGIDNLKPRFVDQ